MATGSDAAAETAYWAVLHAAGVQPPEPSETPPEPPERPSGAIDGDDAPADLLAELERRVQQAPPRTYTPPPAWQPEREPLLVGAVQLVEALESRKGMVRVLVLRTATGDLRTVWTAPVNLAGGLRELELEAGRSLRPADLLALHHRGSERSPGSRYPSKQYAIEAVFTP